MIRIAICDDDRDTIIEHEKIVKDHLRKLKIVGKVLTFQSGDFLLFDVQENIFYDLILLDIEMPGKNGMEIAEKIKKLSPDTLIIFITSHRKYAIDSFELSIFRFVPKDGLEMRLVHAINDALVHIELQKNQMYTISTPTRFEKIPYKKIIYIQKDGKYSLIVTESGDTQIRKTLNKVYEEISSEEFIYIDRACIVNIIHIMRLAENDVVMKNGVFLPVSKKRFRQLKDAINKFWGAQI